MILEKPSIFHKKILLVFNFQNNKFFLNFLLHSPKIRNLDRLPMKYYAGHPVSHKKTRNSRINLY